MKINLLGVKINSDTRAQIIAQISERLKNGRKTFIVTPYSESLVAAQKDREFRDVLNAADFALPDGIGVLWAAHFCNLKFKNKKSKFWKLITTLFSIIFNPKSIRDPIPEKISGSEFVWDLAALAAKNNYSIFLLGGFGDTSEKAAQTLKKEFPNLKIAGTSNVILEDPPKAETIGSDSIAPASPSLQNDKPDFLFVALGPIRQEKWIAQNLSNLPIKLAVGLGGTFDYLAGKRPYRSRFWASAGLEWLWRLLTQPWRVRRILKGVLGLIYYCVKAR